MGPIKDKHSYEQVRSFNLTASTIFATIMNKKLKGTLCMKSNHPHCMNQTQDTGLQVSKYVVIAISIIKVLEAFEIVEAFLPKYIELGIGVKQAQWEFAQMKDTVPYISVQYQNNVCKIYFSGYFVAFAGNNKNNKI